MNPPLSYIDPSNVAAVKVFAGITPVSLGGDSIGGTIAVASAAPTFAAARIAAFMPGASPPDVRSASLSPVLSMPAMLPESARFFRS